MNPLLQGILLGLTLSILLGPIAFIYLETTIKSGWRAAIMTGIGVWVSDLCYILFSLFAFKFLLQISRSESFVFWVGLAGGLILIGLGLATFFQPKNNASDSFSKENSEKLSTTKYWLKGFLINSLSPFSALVWIGAIGSVSGQFLDNQSAIPMFVIGVLGTMILTDLLKIFLADRLINLLSDVVLSYLKKISGAAIFIFGVFLILKII